MMVVCLSCGENKPQSFYHPSKHHRTGIRPRCKPCTLRDNAEWRKQNAISVARGKRKYAANNKARIHAYKQRHKAASKYGLSLEEYRRRHTLPCEICGSSTKPNIDHCHKTGQVRGTLCWRCNVAIGHMNDDPRQLQAAAEYLRRYREARAAQEDCA